MDDEESEETEERDSHESEIIDIDSGTRNIGRTTERIRYIDLLEHIVERFERYAGNRDDIDVPEDRFTFCVERDERQRHQREHHDTSPPAELTREERIRAVEPGTGDIFIDRVPEIGEIEWRCHREGGLQENARQYPVTSMSIGLAERKYLECGIGHQECYDDYVYVDSYQIGT